MIVPVDIFRRKVNPSDPCRLVAFVSDLSNSLDSLVNYGDELWPNQLTLPGRNVSSSRCIGVPSCNYNSIGLGTGYDVYKGNPLTTAAGGIDPGITYNAIFDFANEPSVQANAGSGVCSQSSSVSASYSFAQYQSKQSKT